MKALPAMPPMVARVLRFISALVICFVIGILISHIWWPFRILICGAMILWLARVAHFEGSWVGWLKVKVREWGTDLRQLVLWAKLAFKPKRDSQDVATMAHQAQFLDGRVLSTTNVFTYLPLILGVLGVATIGIDQWRIDRIKKERDAPCAKHELTRRVSDNEFRTSRASCAQLGATNEVAQQWAQRALEAEEQRDAEVTRIREETASEIARQQVAAQRTQALVARQRRRENEGIEAALGGAPPDLERSVCELTGRVDCDAAGANRAPAPPAPASIVPDASTSADATRAADTP